MGKFGKNAHGYKNYEIIFMCSATIVAFLFIYTQRFRENKFGCEGSPEPAYLENCYFLDENVKSLRKNR